MNYKESKEAAIKAIQDALPHAKISEDYLCGEEIISAVITHKQQHGAHISQTFMYWDIQSILDCGWTIKKIHFFNKLYKSIIYFRRLLRED